jgi:hypothetical protein
MGSRARRVMVSAPALTNINFDRDSAGCFREGVVVP